MTFKKWILVPHRRFSIFATMVSTIGLALLIYAAYLETKRHLYKKSVIEGKRENVKETDIEFKNRMNRKILLINMYNTIGTILVFCGFFLQQIYNLLFRMP